MMPVDVERLRDHVQNLRGERDGIIGAGDLTLSATDVNAIESVLDAGV